MIDLLKQDEFENIDFIEIQELDRKRIASELHDTSLQDLTHIIHQVELSGLYIDVDPTKAKLELEDISEQLRRVIQDIRNTIFDLRPMSFDDLGLGEAIDQYIVFLQKKYKIDIESEMDNIDYLEEKKKLAIYRILQECLINSAKHANANKVNLKLKDNDSDIILIIEDNGVGINKNMKNDNPSTKTHYGLEIVKDRVSFLNGVCSITSKENVGTQIKVTIPNKKGVSYEN